MGGKVREMGVMGEIREIREMGLGNKLRIIPLS